MKHSKQLEEARAGSQAAVKELEQLQVNTNRRRIGSQAAVEKLEQL